MTKVEDLPLEERDTITTIMPVKRRYWANREALKVLNADAARELAYATVGRDAPVPNYKLSAEPVLVEVVESVDSVPEDCFGLKYTWSVTRVGTR